MGSAEGVALGRVDVPYSQALPGPGLGSWLPTASLSPETPRVPFGHLDNSFVLLFGQSMRVRSLGAWWRGPGEELVEVVSQS